MDEVATPTRNNGKKAIADMGNEDKKPRRQRTMRAIAQMAGAEEMKEVSHTYKVDTLTTEWKNVPLFTLFSRSSDGSFPCLKSSKSSFIDIGRERQETNIFAGNVYRLY